MRGRRRRLLIFLYAPFVSAPVVGNDVSERRRLFEVTQPLRGRRSIRTRARRSADGVLELAPAELKKKKKEPELARPGPPL